MCLTEKEAKDYREYLERLASQKSAKMFSNGGKDHAIVLYSVLLAHTKLKARFFCEGAMSEIWQSQTFRNSLVDALRRVDFSVEILTRNDAEPDFSWLPGELRDKVKISRVTDNNLEIINKHFQTNSCNFSVFDTEMFRYEYDVQNFKAYGSFNEPEVAQSMIELFDRCFAA